eukprot:TRINITY_DN1011_c0_g1_i1.p1 TRINITY_DN1011_c0_g1~~TRINITY_DN1011_c0_g1_i1.p1  ORF type:complete len:214 (+),score=39.63 TRINITY_DN1011_c0_g1_i1:74-715(+)
MKVILIALIFFSSLVTAFYRIAHASPDAPPVDIIVDGEVVQQLTNISFKDVTRYQSIKDGQHRFQFVKTGTTGPSLIDIREDVNEVRAITISAVGLLAKIEPQIYNDDSRPAAQNRAAVRFIHLIPDAPAVDVAVSNGQVLFRDVTFRTATRYIEVQEGPYNLEVRAAGTSTVVTRFSTRLDSTFVYSIFAEGLLKDEGDISALVVIDERPTI